MEYLWKDLTITVNFDALVSIRGIGPDQVQLRVSRKAPPPDQPALDIAWKRPLKDMQCMWHPSCAKNRSLRVDWQGPVVTSLFRSAPVFCFMNEAGRNRLTYALSDPITEIHHSCGVHEEDGSLLLRIHVSLEVLRTREEYVLSLLRDERDTPYEQALQAVTAWWEDECGFRPMPVPEAARLPVYSTWYSFHQNTVAGSLEQECAQAAQSGFHTFIVDDGWQTSNCGRGYGYCGDWYAAKDKIPDMRAHIQAIHGMNMTYMLWYNMAYVGEHSDGWQRFSTMLLTRVKDQQAGVLDPRYPQVRLFLVDTYAEALKQWNLDGFKLDFIDSFLNSTKAPPFREGMDFALVEDAVAQLLTDIRRALQAIKPNILIEFRQSYIGPAMRGFCNMLRVSDCPADWLSNRVGMADLRLLSGSTAVHSDMLMWHPEDTVENAARQILNVFFAVPQISVRLESLPEEHRRMLCYFMDFMQRHRNVLQAPIQAEAPHMLYPVIRASKDQEEIIVVYERGKVVTLTQASSIFLFNATEEPEVILRCSDQPRRRVSIIDCMGRPCLEQPLHDAAFQALPIPPGGHACLTVDAV